MKSLALLPLALVAASCVNSVPYHMQQPPYRNGEPYYPYSHGRGPDQGRYQPMADRNSPPPPAYDSAESEVEERPRIEETTPAPQPKPKPQGRKDYPIAERTEKPGMVLSPYAPYNVIDVQDFQSGDLAKDPSNGKIFQVP